MEGPILNILDGIVQVNSLFALGVFMELAWNVNPADPSSSLARVACAVGNDYALSMFFYSVLSFTSFLVSSLVALSLKQAILFGRLRAERPWGTDKVSKLILKAGIIMSTLGLVFGCSFLMMAIVHIVQIRMGKLGCNHAPATARTIAPLVIMVPTAILIYVCVLLHSLFH